MRYVLAVLMVILLCGAKATVGAEFNGAALPQLQVGQSTLHEAVALLGREPDIRQVGKSGAMGYTWSHISAKSRLFSSKVTSENKRVMLVFSTDGTFQRILQVEGISLAPEDLRRLMTDPAAATAAK